MVGESVGNYRIISELGSGGMGVVYLAEHTLVGKKSAIKVLRPELSKSQDMVQRFFNEAKATSQLRHPGLVSTHDFGYLPNGCAFLVMEYLEGESLAARLKREGRLPPHLVIDVSLQVANALGVVHQQAIVHRDLKPDNVHLVSVENDPSIVVKVLDFGIAKLHGNLSPSIKTKTGQLMGTPAYMSPEQCRGAGAVDTRSDIYSLACVMFQMATGRIVFTGLGPGDVIAQHLATAPPKLRQISPHMPEALEKIIARMLEKNPDDRYQTMEEVAADLEAIASGREPSGVVVLPPVIQPVPRSPAEIGEEPTAPRPAAPLMTTAPSQLPAPLPSPEPRSSTGRAVTILVTALLLAGGVLLYFLFGRR